jgi:hypothetical protein
VILSLLQGSDPAVVRERVRRILARDEFDRGENKIARWLGERMETATEWIRDLLGLSAGSARVALVILLSVAVLLALWALGRFLARRRAGAAGLGSETGASPASARAASVAALLREARAASSAGDRIAALRLYFRALVLGLSERGELRYRDAWTNRELLERGAPRRDVLPLLAPLVPRLDAQSFGREPASPEDVAHLAALCDRLFGRREA